jgi:vacuolar-type H+-ATPase subunit F/Vma7
MDEDLLNGIPHRRLQQIKNSNTLLVSIPGSSRISQSDIRKQRIAEMIHAAVGIHITFKGQENE